MAKSTLSPKDNFMRLANFEMPDYVPIYMMGFDCYKGETAVKSAMPMELFPNKQIADNKYIDMWGVTQKSNREGGGMGALPEPGNIIMPDVTKWDQVIKAPAMPDVDWEMLAKKGLEPIDRSQSAVMSGFFFSPFLTLVSFMGFTEGLCALYEEPEACEELLDYLCDFYVPIIEKCVEYYKPDLVSMGDDFASEKMPFFGKDVYNRLFKKVYHRLAQPAIERGLPIIFHLCGNGEGYVQELYDFGVRFWEPAQGRSNDLLAVKEKYKGKMNIIGGFDWQPPETWPHVEEEYVRQMLRDCYDKYAPGGGYAYIGHILENGLDDPIAKKCNDWLNEESYYYGRDYYLK